MKIGILRCCKEHTADFATLATQAKKPNFESIFLGEHRQRELEDFARGWIR